MAHIVFVIICFLIDEILTVIFPNSYLINDLLFIPNLGFCAMVQFVNSVFWIPACSLLAAV